MQPAITSLVEFKLATAGASTLTFAKEFMGLHIDIVFFKGDDLISRGEVRCGTKELTQLLEGTEGHRFEITSRFDEPACPVEILCTQHDKQLYKSALRVGVHTSEDWESIDLAGIHTLGFRCRKLE